jgi:hypothetical protein
MDDYISNKKEHILCGWSRKILQAKVTCNTKSKSVGRRAMESPRNSTSKIERRSTSSPLILGRSFLKTVGTINIGKGEVMFDIDGVRSALKSTMFQGM